MNRLKINWIVKYQHQEGITRLIHGFYTTFGGQDIVSWQDLKVTLVFVHILVSADWGN